MIKLYKYKEIPEFINDKAYIDNKLKKKNIEIIDDEYKERVNILLGNN